MITTEIKGHLYQNIEEIMISADEVAHVQNENTLSHAMLVLTTVKYTMIPVLDKSSHLVGLITMPHIIKSITTIESINIDQLDEKLVHEAMIEPPVTITKDASFEKIMQLLVNYNFISVIDNRGVFQGIVTRSHVLKKINALFHDISAL